RNSASVSAIASIICDAFRVAAIKKEARSRVALARVRFADERRDYVLTHCLRQTQGKLDLGVLLTPIVVKEQLSLEDLRGKTLAVDGNGELYQFLALIRLRDGSPLMDSKGRITSHLSGLFYRVTRLIADYGIELVFVMDGKPPALKFAEIERR